jgi:hypothetical protein
MKSIFVLLLLPLQLFSQDLSGIWVGTIATAQTQMPYELAINRDMTGYSMITFMFKGAEKIAVKKITLIQKDSIFTISDDKLIYNNIETKHRNIKSFCELSIKMVDTMMVLSGPFHTRSRDLRPGDEDLSTGTITLQKQNYKAQTRLMGKLDSLKLSNTLTFSDSKVVVKESPTVAVVKQEAPAVPVAKQEAPAVAVAKQAAPPAATTSAAPSAVARMPEKDSTVVKVQQQAAVIPVIPKVIAPAAEVALRKTEVIRTIDFKSDSLTLILFDNGIVDGDTVSVVLNDEVIIPKLGLTDQVYRKVIKIPPGLGDSLQLVIYAENLGTIPPNSGMLIIEDGSNRQEIAFEGDLKKSAAVKLRRKQ